MKDSEHREIVEAALKFEKTERIPVNNFALVTAARSAGIAVKDARYNPKISAKVSIDYALKTKSDFVKPVIDSQMVFADLGMQVDFPDDDYGTVKSILATQDNIDSLEFFDVRNASECPHFTDCIIKQLNETEKTLPEDLHICGLSWGPVTTAGYLLGTENLIMSLMMEDGIAEKAIKKCTRFVADQQLAMSEAGATLMWVADPTSSGDLLSPDMYNLTTESLHEVATAYKKKFNNPTFVHICGNTEKLIPELTSIGIDCLSFDYAVDPAKAKIAANKKIALMGNIDPVKFILQGNQEEIRNECGRIIDACGKESGFILAPGCETPISSPDQNVIAMQDAARDYKF